MSGYGVIEDRNSGLMIDGATQTVLSGHVLYRIPGFLAVVEVRVRVKPDRFRIPDVTIVRGGMC